jgi:hypothetical protein
MFGASSRHDRVFFEGFKNHADRLVEASRLLAASLAHPSADSDDQKVRQEVRDIRQRADRIARDLVCELRQTWITPFDPQDVRSLIVAFDDAVEVVYAAVERLTLLRPRATNGEEIHVRKLADLLVRCAEGLQHAVELLGKKHGDREILQRCAELRRVARDADDVYREAMGALYGAGGGGGTEAGQVLELLKWQELLIKLEEAVGGCGRVALELETIVEAHA